MTDNEATDRIAKLEGKVRSLEAMLNQLERTLDLFTRNETGTTYDLAHAVFCCIPMEGKL